MFFILVPISQDLHDCGYHDLSCHKKDRMSDSAKLYPIKFSLQKFNGWDCLQHAKDFLRCTSSANNLIMENCHRLVQHTASFAWSSKIVAHCDLEGKK